MIIVIAFIIGIYEIMPANSASKIEPLKQGTIKTIDSCEYVVNDAYGGWSYVHHGNCKYCAERRKQELKEIIKELKGI